MTREHKIVRSYSVAPFERYGLTLEEKVRDDGSTESYRVAHRDPSVADDQWTQSIMAAISVPHKELVTSDVGGKQVTTTQVIPVGHPQFIVSAVRKAGAHVQG